MAEERVEPDLKVLNSYLVMQSFIRQLIQEAASYGMNQLMIEISRVIPNALIPLLLLWHFNEIVLVNNLLGDKEWSEILQ